jgi:hypothetical protein
MGAVEDLLVVGERLLRLRQQLADRYRACGSLVDDELLKLSRQLDVLCLEVVRRDLAADGPPLPPAGDPRQDGGDRGGVRSRRGRPPGGCPGAEPPLESA